MQGLLEEGETMMHEAPAGALRDAVMITGAQKVEHYEMASYGTVRTYAQLLGETNVARMLQRTLDEERAADLELTQIAEASVNEAAAEWQAQEEDDGLLSRAAAAIGLTRPASKSRSSKVPRARTSAHKRVAARRVAKKR